MLFKVVVWAISGSYSVSDYLPVYTGGIYSIKFPVCFSKVEVYEVKAAQSCLTPISPHGL